MESIPKNRLEAFSDGVIAILITIMVLELKAPHEATLPALKPLLPELFSYVLSFVYLAIYWNNHHHLLHATKKVNGAVLWANTHLLFWLSLFPFVTAWVGETHGGVLPTALYGGVFFMAAVAYFVLQQCIIASQGRDSVLAAALGSDWKGKLSPLCYLAAIAIAFVSPIFSIVIYVSVAILWVIPDRRIENMTEA